MIFLINIFNDKKVNIKDTIIEIKYKYEDSLKQKRVVCDFTKDKIKAPKEIGINNKKENSFCLFESNFERLAANIVVPLREIPGKIAKHWNNPTTIVFLNV